MASTNKTSSYGLTQFVATDKPSWLTDYNGDMATIDGASAASGVHPAVVSKAGNQHTVVFGGEGDMCRFTATADFNKGDALKLNGAVIPVLDCDGNAFVGEAWKTGDRVVLAIAPTNVRVLAPLRNKANIGAVAPIPLTMASGVTSGAGNSYYYKDQFGVVHVRIAATKDSGFTHSSVVATLPSGYFKTDYRCIGIVYGGETNSRIPCMLSCSSNGEIVVMQCGTAFNKQPYMAVDFSFLPN